MTLPPLLINAPFDLEIISKILLQILLLETRIHPRIQCTPEIGSEQPASKLSVNTYVNCGNYTAVSIAERDS